jgi:hypothetical protein
MKLTLIFKVAFYKYVYKTLYVKRSEGMEKKKFFLLSDRYPTHNPVTRKMVKIDAVKKLVVGSAARA